MHDFCLFDTSPDFMLKSFLNRHGSILFPEIFHFSHMPAAFRIKPAILMFSSIHRNISSGVFILLISIDLDVYKRQDGLFRRTRYFRQHWTL